MIVGILVGLLKKEAIFHAISWISQKSRHPVKSTPVAELLAAGKVINECKSIANSVQELLGIKIEMQLYVGSKHLFTSLSIQRQLIDRLI